MNKIATFFGGAVNDTTTPEYYESIEIGKLLAEKNYTVYNGGYRGLMEAVSKGCKENGGEVRGFTCKSFGSTKGNEYLTHNLPCNNIYDRLLNLISFSELFIIQRGGIGTLSELFLTMDIYRKVKENKPKIILFGKHWIPLMDIVKNNYMSEKEKDIFEIISTFEEFKTII